METDDEELSNVGVRASLHLKRDIESFAYRVKTHGIDVTKHPLPYDVSVNKCMGGRKRIKAFIILNERFIPIAKYKQSKRESVRNLISAGLQENQKHDSADDSEFEDYVTAAKALIMAGELKRTEEDVESWLRNDVRIDEYFSKKTIDKLVEHICSLDEKGMELMRCVDRQDATAYSKKYLKKLKQGDENHGLDFDKDILLMSPNEVNIYRILGHMIANAKLGKRTNVILYSTLINPEKATHNMTYYVTELIHELVGGLCHLINYDLPENWPEQLSFQYPFKSNLLNIIGCIPQKVGNKTHESKYASHDIINVEDY
jgi:hypothetical protein